MLKYALARFHRVDLWFEIFRTDGVWDHVMDNNTEWTKVHEEMYETVAWSLNEEEQGPVWPVARIFESYDSAKRVLFDDIKRGSDKESYQYEIVCISASAEMINVL